MTGELVRFETFQGIQSLTLDSVKVDTTGAFTFTFTFKTDKPAIGYLITAANKPYFVILDKNERIRLKGQHIGYPESIQIMEGQRNYRRRARRGLCPSQHCQYGCALRHEYAFRIGLRRQCVASETYYRLWSLWLWWGPDCYDE